MVLRSPKNHQKHSSATVTCSCVISSSENASATYRHTKEVGLVHDVQHQFPHFPVVHGEVVVTVLPLFDAEKLHHAGKGFSDDPDPVVSEPVELAGLHALLLELPAVLPLVLFRGLEIKWNMEKRNFQIFA